MGLYQAIQDYYKNRKIRNHNRQVISDNIDNLIPDLTVKNGPFKGMLYPSRRSAGSALFPKLLGSYESELHNTINECINNNYTEIIDVGCAEGYYAIGMAIKLPNSKIFAFDTNQKALTYLANMAELNNIDPNRITVDSHCSENTLLNIHIRKKALFICDCEGCEKDLFTAKSHNFLSSHDLLIEAHDLFNIEISTYLIDLFQDTHNIKIIQSIDDIQKAKTYTFQEVIKADLSTKKILLAEGRKSIMEWLYMESKLHDNT